MNRRRALRAVLSFPAIAVAGVSGCSGGDPNQFVSGTMVKPLESVEKADEIAAKKLEEKLRSKGRKKAKR
jgi:hypothetical protein